MVTPFEDAYEQARNRTDSVSVLLGNGFSIAAAPTFDYRRLLDVAEFGSNSRSDRIRTVFETVGTADFEMVIDRLEAAAETLDLYKSVSRTVGRIGRDARQVRRALARALADVHPDRIGDVRDARLNAANDFLGHFGEVFTTNYDLLLYWALGRDWQHFDDGFRSRNGSLVHVEPDEQNVHYLHGAVHLHEHLRAGEEPLTEKQQWTRATPLVDRLRDDLSEGRIPMIVMEGTWQQKQRRINRSPYLSHALARLRKVDGALFTYGVAFSGNDEHIVQAIVASDVEHLYVGLYGGKKEGTNPDTVGQAHRIEQLADGDLEVEFWDTESADAWPPP